MQNKVTEMERRMEQLKQRNANKSIPKLDQSHPVDVSIDPDMASTQTAESSVSNQAEALTAYEVADVTNSKPWNGSQSLGEFSLPSLQSLPAKPEAWQLLQEIFESFNLYMPLFDETEFIKRFHEQYAMSASEPYNLAWWACINVALALGHRFRAMRLSDPSHENARSCKYIHNALAVVAGLSVMPNSLAAIQALLGMAIVLRGSPNMEASSILVATAMRQLKQWVYIGGAVMRKFRPSKRSSGDECSGLPTSR